MTDVAAFLLSFAIMVTMLAAPVIVATYLSARLRPRWGPVFLVIYMISGLLIAGAVLRFRDDDRWFAGHPHAHFPCGFLCKGPPARLDLPGTGRRRLPVTDDRRLGASVRRPAAAKKGDA